MATGPENYQAAERLIAAARKCDESARSSALLADAQVHATLALAAATAMGAIDTMAADDFSEWDEACGFRDPMPDPADG